MAGSLPPLPIKWEHFLLQCNTDLIFRRHGCRNVKTAASVSWLVVVDLEQFFEFSGGAAERASLLGTVHIIILFWLNTFFFYLGPSLSLISSLAISYYHSHLSRLHTTSTPLL
jgi:hypothetical protein